MNNINHNSINWFPGHMSKATRLIKEKIKLIDIIIEIVDSRAINITSNYELINSIAKNKKIIKIALKKDLSDELDDEILSGSINDKKFKQKVLNKINDISKPIINNMKKKGIKNPKLYLMVIGLPNVGKSSFINFMLNKNHLIANNKPGITRSNSWTKLNDNIDIMDTPGILFKKINKIENGYILALLRCINWEIVPKYETIEFAYFFHMKNYKKKFESYFFNQNDNNFEFFLKKYCEIKKLYIKKNELDFDKALDRLYKEFSNGKICKINYELNK